MLARPNVILWSLLTLCIARFWLVPLTSSFWVDEAATAFVVHHGAGDPSLAIVPQVPASIYYTLPKAAERALGFSEVVYRLPSLVVMLAALAVIFQLGKTLIHPAAGWMVVFACLSLRGFNYQADDARPYGLGTCVAALSLLLLTQWLNRGHLRDALLFGITAALVWRIHLIFWPFYLVLAIYTIIRIVKRETPVAWPEALGVFLLVGLSLVPVLLNALRLDKDAQAHVITVMPSLRDLSRSLHIGMVAGFISVSALLAYWRGWRFRGLHLNVLVLGWWLCQPMGLFLFSWITGSSVFVPRYLFLSLPGAALVAASMAAPFIPDDAWKPLSALLGIGVLIALGNWTHLSTDHDGAQWREAATAINKVAGLRPDTPVICPSPFVEAQSPAWSPGYSPAGFLYSQLQVYPIRGKIFPFPFRTSQAAEANATNLARNVLASAGEFVIYGGRGNVRYWKNWFSSRPELSTWKSRPLGAFGDVQAVLFEK